MNGEFTDFFWDLIDLNNDGEDMEIPFVRFWDATTNGGSRKASDMANKLIINGYNKEKVVSLWEKAFLTNWP